MECVAEHYIFVFLELSQMWKLPKKTQKEKNYVLSLALLEYPGKIQYSWKNTSVLLCWQFLGFIPHEDDEHSVFSFIP